MRAVASDHSNEPTAAVTAASTSARSPNALKWMRKRFASWDRKANCCARSSPRHARKRRVLEGPVLYRSGAPWSMKMGTIASPWRHDAGSVPCFGRQDRHRIRSRTSPSDRPSGRRGVVAMSHKPTSCACRGQRLRRLHCFGDVPRACHEALDRRTQGVVSQCDDQHRQMLHRQVER